MEQPARYFHNNVSGSATLLDAPRALRRRPVRVLLLGRGVRHARPEPRSTSPRRSTRRASTARPSSWSSACSSWFDATVGMRSVSLRYFNAAGASSDGDDRRGLRHHPEPRAGADEGPARQAAAAARSSAPTTPPPTAPPCATTSTSRIWPRPTCSPSSTSTGAAPTTALNLGTGTGSSVAGGARRGAPDHRPGRAGDVRAQACRRPDVLVADTTRAAELLGWQPRLGLDDIIASAWQWHSRAP